MPSVAGGYDFPADPKHSALDQPVIWSPLANPAVLMLGATPDFLTPSPAALSVDLVDVICGPEGAYGACRAGDGVQYVILADTDADAQTAIILPLDGDLPDRLEAILRLWHMLATKPVRRDPRMTPYQRRRFRLMMQAADGNANHATYREIAIAIYGRSVFGPSRGRHRLCGHLSSPLSDLPPRSSMAAIMTSCAIVENPDADARLGVRISPRRSSSSPMPTLLRHRAHDTPLIVSGILHNHGGPRPMRPDLAALPPRYLRTKEAATSSASQRARWKSTGLRERDLPITSSAAASSIRSRIWRPGLRAERLPPRPIRVDRSSWQNLCR